MFRARVHCIIKTFRIFRVNIIYALSLPLLYRIASLPATEVVFLYYALRKFYVVGQYCKKILWAFENM